MTQNDNDDDDEPMTPMTRMVRAPRHPNLHLFIQRPLGNNRAIAKG
jgi:hypothetical protein